jgi:hypothetical protein
MEIHDGQYMEGAVTPRPAAMPPAELADEGSVIVEGHHPGVTTVHRGGGPSGSPRRGNT